MSEDSKIKITSQEAEQFAIKRKWQIALRRYLMEGNPSTSYAPYFGLPALDLKKWVEIQFTDKMTWDNFGKEWNLSQRVPAGLFNLSDKDDLKLCWHFTNIMVNDQQTSAIDSTKAVLAALPFYKILFFSTGLETCEAMVNRLTNLQTQIMSDSRPFEGFLKARQEEIGLLASFDSEDFLRLNKGENLQDILTEKEIIRKYGS